MKKVGITGGIGSGKSLVCEVFQHIGIPHFSADLIAKELINYNSEIKNNLIELFGKGIYLKNGTIHRKKFADIIFNNQIALQKVNKIVHPYVRHEFNIWANKQSSDYVIQEAAILFENNQTKFFDKIITVTAPLELKIERVMKRDCISRELVEERMKNQLPDEIKVENSDFVIFNDNIKMILPQIIEIHNKLK